MLNTKVKEKLRAGETVLGTFCKINSPSVVEILGLAGFDFIVVDAEHAAFSHSDIENIVRTADSVGLSSIIRVEEGSESNILHALDGGAGGIQIPGLTQAAQVREAVEYAKYFPLGKRGMSLAQRAAGYGLADPKDYIKKSNEDTLLVVHIENKEMVDQIEELCRIPEVDVLFVGPGDLSQSFGKPGALDAPEVVAAVERVFETARRYGKHTGIYVGGPAALEKYLSLGAAYITFQADVNLLAGAARETVKRFMACRGR